MAAVKEKVLLKCSPLRRRFGKSAMRNKSRIYIADDKFFDVHTQLQLRGFTRW